MDGTEVFGLTTPLITRADGTKMGKSVTGAVWLNEAQLPSYDFWQYWRNVDDRDVGKFLRLFTDLPLDEIERLEALGGNEINAAKIALANAVTALCRGEDAARTAQATASDTFGGSGLGADLPVFETPDAEIGLIDALVGLGFAASRGEAKRLIAGGGARVDGEAVMDEARRIVLGEADVRISAGKKKHGVLRRT
jgi:tyrosyl-tRNA synthetase